MDTTSNITSLPKSDFSPKVKFALTLGTNLTIGLLGVAATVAVGLITAKMMAEVESAE